MKKISICAVQTDSMALAQTLKTARQWLITIYHSLHKSIYSRCDSTSVNGNEEVVHVQYPICMAIVQSAACYNRKKLTFPFLSFIVIVLHSITKTVSQDSFTCHQHYNCHFQLISNRTRPGILKKLFLRSKCHFLSSANGLSKKLPNHQKTITS